MELRLRDPDHGSRPRIPTTDPDTSSTISHEYTQPDNPNGDGYTVTLTVTDSEGNVSEPAKIVVFPENTPPVSVVEAPADESLFTVGDLVTASETATDLEDAPESIKLDWDVLQYHDANHAHPLQQGTGESVKFNGPPSEGLFSTDRAENYVEVRLTAEDSRGLSATTSMEIRPKTVPLTFRAQPADLKVRVSGEVIRGEETVTAWAGDNLQLIAQRQKDADGRTWAFRSWSDGGDATHTIQAPDAPATYTATFQRLLR